ncbi:MAG: site-specific DNA-methyltransferase [Lentisphaeria bacterium]|nr:site-specific DNA-methyltransferase [Lentisphaeria bacterium]
MAALDDLIQQIGDPELRARIQREADRLLKQKKFGLVFEDHIPECTPLYDIPIRRNSQVALKSGELNDIYRVVKINGDQAECVHETCHDTVTLPLKDLVAVAKFGDPIYPCLTQMDSICNAPDSDLWHTLIEADNYHALQLLEYLYAGKVDCIYIDPPYNSGAKDWKYNNDYVDGSDQYRHSKWLSMMQKRLKIAKKLLNPQDSVLIVTIDEKEYLHLGCLLEEMFPAAHMQMVSIVINPNGVARDHEMYRVEEYAFFVYFGQSGPVMLEDPLFTSDVNQRKNTMGEADESSHSHRTSVRWERLLRGGSDSQRSHAPGCFYPVFIDPVKRRIVDVGESIGRDTNRYTIPKRDGLVTIWPIAEGTQEEKRWQMSPENLKNLVEQGYAKVGAYNKKTDRWSLLYLGRKQRERIEQGQIVITGKDDNGVVIVEEAEEQIIKKVPKTIWNRQAHSAGEYGSRLVRTILPGRVFPYPKSLYAVRDTLKSVLDEKPNALILDFFAGSGTTLHAVNLLNAEDGGHRRCIMVTNNEVSAEESKNLTEQGFHPGDEEWEKLGIARYVNWPRSVCSIKGCDINGKPLKGDYLGSNIPMSDGFKANAIFFKLGFLNKNEVALGNQFKEILSTLWMKAGAIGVCPTIENIPDDMLILPKNSFAVLLDETMFAEFAKKMRMYPDIKTIFFITDSGKSFREMSDDFPQAATYQLYRDYLDNFRINIGR